MKTVLFFTVLIVALACGTFSKTFEQWYRAHDSAHEKFQKSDHWSVKELVDGFNASPYANFFERIHLGEVNDYSARLLHQKALSSYRMGEKEAEQFFGQARDKSSSALTRAEILYNSTERLVYGGDIEAAVSAYKETLKLNPDDWQAKNNLELLLQAQQRQNKSASQVPMGKPGDKRWKDMELFIPVEPGTKKIDK